MKNSNCKNPFAVALFGMALMLSACAHHQVASSGAIQSLLSPELQKKIREAMDSVVEVVNVREYRIEEFDYERQDGRFIRDLRSPVGYRLRGGNALSGVSFDREINKAFGAGLLLMHNDREALILTSSHLATVPDTLLSYYSLQNDQSPDSLSPPLFSRAIAVKTDLSVRHQNQILSQARLMANDKRNDIALLTTAWRPGLAIPFAAAFAYDQPAGIGEIGVAVGFPDEIKQVTFGMISGAPYPKNFSLGIVGRFGFSGCPVLAIRQQNELTLAGIGRGAPVNETATIAPPDDFVNGYYLRPEDISRLRVRRVQQINYGSLYCVDIQRIGEFIAANEVKLREQGFYLPDRFLPDKN
jgi:S1-C subfamily serine protease